MQVYFKFYNSFKLKVDGNNYTTESQLLVNNFRILKLFPLIFFDYIYTSSIEKHFCSCYLSSICNFFKIEQFTKFMVNIENKK